MEELAQVYSRSLLAAAQERGTEELVGDQLRQFVEALDAGAELRTFFFSPYFSVDELKDGLQRVVTDADPTLLNFLTLLIENRRMPAVARIQERYRVLLDRHLGLLPVEVTSATPLDDRVTGRVAEQIGASTGKRVTLTTKVQPGILGGIVLRVGNSILDASIKGRLDALRRAVAHT